MLNDLRGKAVLITGGTTGIGLATGLAFARQGAICTLTHRWGSADEGEIRRRFADQQLPPPQIVEADVSNDDDATRLLEDMRHRHEGIEVFVSNVAMAMVVKDLDDYSLRSLTRSLEYTAWPLWGYTRRIRELFGRYPRYVIGLSSSGPDHFTVNYDFVAASKAVLETLCRYVSYRLFDEDVRVNVVRAWTVRTESLRNTAGRDFEPFMDAVHMGHRFVEPDEVASAVLALASGLMDGVKGQTLMVDHGLTFCDNLMRLFDERHEVTL